MSNEMFVKNFIGEKRYDRVSGILEAVKESWILRAIEQYKAESLKYERLYKRAQAELFEIKQKLDKTQVAA
jgi:hypothetical protein